MKPENANIAYNKGVLIMFGVHEMIGEEKINAARKELLNRHAFPQTPPTSLDLIRLLCEQAQPNQRAKIERLFNH